MTSRTLRILLLLTAFGAVVAGSSRRLRGRAQPDPLDGRQRRLRRAGARGGRRNRAPARRAAGVRRRGPGHRLLDDAGSRAPGRGGPGHRRVGQCLVEPGHALGRPGRRSEPRTVPRARQAGPAVRAEQPEPDGLRRDLHGKPGRADDRRRACRRRRPRTSGVFAPPKAAGCARGSSMPRPARRACSCWWCCCSSRCPNPTSTCSPRCVR